MEMFIFLKAFEIFNRKEHKGNAIPSARDVKC